jgi:hypothetical protein
MTISYEELTGYFDFSNEDTTCEFKNEIYAYPCLVCHSLVLSFKVEDHVGWHKNLRKPDKLKTPKEIQQEAKRELGAIKDELSL